LLFSDTSYPTSPAVCCLNPLQSCPCCLLKSLPPHCRPSAVANTCKVVLAVFSHVINIVIVFSHVIITVTVSAQHGYTARAVLAVFSHVIVIVFSHVIITVTVSAQHGYTARAVLVVFSHLSQVRSRLLQLQLMLCTYRLLTVLS
jgi:hypothetical protein